MLLYDTLGNISGRAITYISEEETCKQCKLTKEIRPPVMTNIKRIKCNETVTTSMLPVNKNELFD